MTEQLLEAGMLLAVGMSVVFVFLTLLIGGIHSIAWFVNKYPAPEASNRGSSPKYSKARNNNNSIPTTVTPNIVAAITAAVHAHRRKNK